MRDDDHRPDPDALLAAVRKAEGDVRRGRLRIFLGMAPGVGKTYAMLEAARLKASEGISPLVGLVETHGRADTEALLYDMNVAPRRRIDYKGRILEEFDLDAALTLHPALILVDELAHTNVPGSRHPKRFQDVEELLEAGIDVWTTLNIQHLESLNDVVAQITGVRVRETVPDAALEGAESIILIDLPPEDLRVRLREGKVYVPKQAEWAGERFFKLGNLTALRELALRATANRVNTEVRDRRIEQAATAVWPTRERILVCVGPSPSSATLVRAAKRLADGLGAPWIALTIQARPEGEAAERALANLSLAGELGAETHVLTGEDAASLIVEFARRENVSRIVVGKPVRRSLLDLFRSGPVDRLIRLSDEIDVHVIKGLMTRTGSPPKMAAPSTAHWKAIVAAVGVTAASTGLGFLMYPFFPLPNLIMVYLVGVTAASVWLPRRASALASVLGVLAFDFCFVPPRFSFSVSDATYLVTFGVMLLVSLVIGSMAARIKAQAEGAVLLERQAQALSGLSRRLSTTRGTSALLEAVREHVLRVFNCETTALLPKASGELRPVFVGETAPPLSIKDLGTAQWAFDNGKPAGFSTKTLAESPRLFLPMSGTAESLGVLGLHPLDAASRTELKSPETRRLLDGFVRQTALALEVDHLAAKAQSMSLEAEREKLRSSLLSTVTHDFKTPLAAVSGSAQSLLSMGEATSSEVRTALLENIADESRRLERLVDNLLRISALESGATTPIRRMVPVEEVIGAALARVEEYTTDHPIALDLPLDLPLVPLDEVLMEQVFLNLFDNAAKHTPPGTRITVSGRARNDRLELVFSDNGPGLPPGDPEALFERFHRGDAGLSPGSGLGLAICRAVVKAHGGEIQARDLASGGAAFTLTLPLT